MSNLNDRIDAAEQDLIAMKDQLVESTKTLEAAPEEEALLHEVEELTSKVEKASATLGALKKAQSALAERAKPVQESPAIVKSHYMGSGAKETNDLIWKHAAIKLIGYAEKKDPRQVIEERYKGDQAIKETFDYVAKTAVMPADTTTTGWAAELVQTDVRGFLDTLKTTSVAAALAGKAQNLSFGGYNSVTIPRRNPLGASLTEPAWVGEGGVIPLTQFSFGSTTLNRYKLAAITTMTKEIAERSTPQIEGLLRSALSEAYGQVLDSALLSNTAAVAGVRPAGLLNAAAWGAATSAGAAAGTTAGSAVRADLQTALAAFQTARVGSRPVIIMNDQQRLSLSMSVSSLGDYLFRDEIGSGRLMGMEVISSQNVPAGTVIIVDADSLALAFDAPEFSVSDVATVTEANADGTAPTQANTTADAKGTVGQVPADMGQMVTAATDPRVAGLGVTARSLWQTYSLGIRMVAPTSWGALRNAGVYSLTAVKW